MKFLIAIITLLFSHCAFALNEITPSEEIMLINFTKANIEISNTIRNIKIEPQTKDGLFDTKEISRIIDSNIAKIIRKHGLTVNEYRSIVQHTERNPYIREYIEYSTKKLMN